MIREYCFNKIGPSNLWRMAGPERIGTAMKTIKELTNSCKTNNLLKYFDFLCKARQVADAAGLRLIAPELKRIRDKYLYLESLGIYGGE